MVEKVLTLAKCYGNKQMSTFDQSPNFRENIIKSDFIHKDVIKLFFKDFKSLVQRENDNQNAEIAKLISEKELPPNKVSNSLVSKTLYKLMRLVLIGPNAEELDWGKVIDLHKSLKKTDALAIRISLSYAINNTNIY